MASTIGGMVINTAGVTLAHGMEHPASGLKNIVHGQGLAALTPVVIDASYKGDEEKFGNIVRPRHRRGGYSVDGGKLHESIRRRRSKQSSGIYAGRNR